MSGHSLSMGVEGHLQAAAGLASEGRGLSVLLSLVEQLTLAGFPNTNLDLLFVRGAQDLTIVGDSCCSLWGILLFDFILSVSAWLQCRCSAF